MAERPLALIGLTAFVCLFFLGDFSGILPAWLVLALSVPVAALAFILLAKSDKKRLLSMFAAAAVTCAAFSILFIAHTKTNYQSALSAVSQNTTVKAKMISNPEESDGRYYYILKTIELDGVPFSAKLRYMTYEKLSDEPHTMLTISATEIYPLGEMGTVWHTSWKAEGVFIGAYGTVQNAEPPTVRNLSYYILQFQAHITKTILETLPSQAGAVLLGFLLGNVDYIDYPTYAASKITGITHLFSVSGLHVSIWSFLIAFLLKKTGLPARLRSIFCILFVLFLIVITGVTPPAVRAGITMIILFFGEMVFKEADSLNSLGFSMIALLLVNPFAARSISLILSFSAALGILLFAEKMDQYCKEKTSRWRSKQFRRCVNFLLPSLSISFSVMLSSFLWMIYFFGSLSVIAPLTNLFVVLPSSAAMVLTGFAVLLSGVDFLFYPLITLAGLLANYIIGISSLLAKIPGALIQIEPFLMPLSVAAAILGALILLRKKAPVRFWRSVYCLFVVVLLSSNILYALVPTSRVTLTVPSVGNGSALIITKNNQSALIGCGGKERSLSFALASENIFGLDFLLIPRVQATESGAMERIILDFSPANILASEDFIENKALLDEHIVFSNSATETLFETISFDFLNTADFSALMLHCNGQKIIMTFLPASDFSAMPPEWQSGDVLICRAAVPQSLDASRFATVIIGTDAENHPLSTRNRGTIRISIHKNGETKLEYGE